MNDAVGETVLKIMAPRSDLERLRQRLLEFGGQAKGFVSSHPVSTYYDTADRRLQRSGLSLRVREQGETISQTLKRARTTRLGLHRVWETSVALDTAVLDLSRMSDADSQSLAELVGRKQLRPVFTTRVSRSSRIVEADAGRVEVAIDDGQIVAQGGQEPISEIEFELLSGERAVIWDVAKVLLADLPALPVQLSKAERGYLVADRLPRPQALPALTGRPPRCAHTWTLDVFEIFLEFYAGALATNLFCAMTQSHAEGPHQSRVALRRLRALFWLCRPVVNPVVRREVADGCKTLGEVLAPLRDADVFIDDIIRPALSKRHDARLIDRLEAWREQVRAEVRSALREAGASGAALSLFGLLHDRGWCVRNGEPASRLVVPFAQIARPKLKAEWKRICQSGDRLGELSTDARHELRKKLKRFRYALEIAAQTFPNGQKNISEFLFRLRKVQTYLGRLNDLESIAATTPNLEDSGAQSQLERRLKALRERDQKQSNRWLRDVRNSWTELVGKRAFSSL